MSLNLFDSQMKLMEFFKTELAYSLPMTHLLVSIIVSYYGYFGFHTCVTPFQAFSSFRSPLNLFAKPGVSERVPCQSLVFYILISW